MFLSTLFFAVVAHCCCLAGALVVPCYGPCRRFRPCPCSLPSEHLLMRLGLLDHRAESSSLSSCQALRRWRWLWLCRRLAGPPPCLPCVAALHVSSPLSGQRRGSICCCRLAAPVVAARRSWAALLLACCCCQALLPVCSLLVLAWLVSVAVLGVAFLPHAGACGVVVVCRAALRRLPFAALAGWLGCWAGLVARSCSGCLTSFFFCVEFCVYFVFDFCSLFLLSSLGLGLGAWPPPCVALGLHVSPLPPRSSSAASALVAAVVL